VLQSLAPSAPPLLHSQSRISLSICQSPNKISASCLLFPPPPLWGSKQSGDVTHLWTTLACNLLKPQEDKFVTVVSLCASLSSQNYSWVLHGASTKTGVQLQTLWRFVQRAFIATCRTFRSTEFCGCVTAGGCSCHWMVILQRNILVFTELN